MTSQINPAYPSAESPTTASVRANFAAAATEITELQEQVGALATVASTGSYNDLTDVPTTFTPPVATTSTVGGVKVDGNTILVDQSGMIRTAIRTSALGDSVCSLNFTSTLYVALHGQAGASPSSLVSLTGQPITSNGVGFISTSKFASGAYDTNNGAGTLTIPVISPPHPPLLFGTDAFTIEFWASTDGGSAIAGRRNVVVSGPGWQIATRNPGYFDGWHLHLDTDVGGYSRIVGTGITAVSSWQHIALVSDGTTLKMFVNGTQRGSASVRSMEGNYTTGNIQIGSANWYGQIYGLNVVKGTALYTGTFTPLVQPAAGIRAQILSLFGGDATPPATTTSRGTVMVGAGLNVTSDGVLSADGGSSLTTGRAIVMSMIFGG